MRRRRPSTLPGSDAAFQIRDDGSHFGVARVCHAPAIDFDLRMPAYRAALSSLLGSSAYGSVEFEGLTGRAKTLNSRWFGMKRSSHCNGDLDNEIE
jgi:hypothetical protein